MAESQGAHLPLLGMGWHAATSVSAGRPRQHVLYIKECVKVSKTHAQETGCKQAEVSGVQALLWAGRHAAEAQPSSQREPGCIEEKSQSGNGHTTASMLASNGKGNERKKEDEVEGLA